VGCCVTRLSILIGVCGFCCGFLVREIGSCIGSWRTQRRKKIAAAVDCALRVPFTERAEVVANMLESGLISIDQAIEIYQTPGIDRRQHDRG